MGKEKQPRARHHISETRLKLMSPLVRYSYSRDAFILRGVGKHVGPVYRVAAQADPQPSYGHAGSADPRPTRDRGS